MGTWGRESLDELWRVAAPGAVCSIAINAAHFDSQGFAQKISDDVKRNVVTEPDINIANTYTHKLTDVDDENNQSVNCGVQSNLAARSIRPFFRS